MKNIDNKKVWHEVLESLKVSVSPANFTTWFKQTHLVDIKKENERFVAEVGCASSFIKNTIENRYFGLVQDNLQKSLDANCDITFTVKENPEKSTPYTNTVVPLFQTPSNSTTALESIIKAGIRPGFTFKNFAVSSSNQMA